MSRTTHRFLLVAALALHSACATTAVDVQPSTPATPQPQPERGEPQVSALDEAIMAAARAYGESKASGDFGAIWDSLAPASQRLSISVSKAPAERDEARAKSQGFSSSEAVRALSDRAYFTARRSKMKESRRYSYPPGVTVDSVSLGPAVYVPVAGERLLVYPATLGLTDGSSDTVGVTKLGSRFRIVEP